MKNDSIEISVKGTWIKVPALDVNGDRLVATGRWLKVAFVHDEAWLESEINDPEACVRELKNHAPRGLRADIFTFAQKLPAIVPKYKYSTEWDSIAAIPLTNFKTWWESVPQETRKNVRRAQKRGVVVDVRPFDDALVQGISGVNNESAVRQRMRNTYYGKTLDQIRKDYSSFCDRSDFICAYLGDELIGFLKIVYRGDVASILNLTTKLSHSDKRPANALVAKAVELCEARAITHITYGYFNYGNKRDSSLRQFKVRNGFEEVLVPRFYLPLTMWGRLCISLNLHRGLLAVLPHRVIAMGVSARGKLHDLKQAISRRSSMPERSNCDRQMGCSNPPAGSNF